MKYQVWDKCGVLRIDCINNTTKMERAIMRRLDSEDKKVKSMRGKAQSRNPEESSSLRKACREHINIKQLMTEND